MPLLYPRRTQQLDTDFNYASIQYKKAGKCLRHIVHKVLVGLYCCKPYCDNGCVVMLFMFFLTEATHLETTYSFTTIQG